MDDKLLKFECLKLAIEVDFPGKKIIELAQDFYDFVEGNLYDTKKEPTA